MTDTSNDTSDAKLCTECGAAFDRDDDKRFSRCKNCRPQNTAAVDSASDVSGAVKAERVERVERREYEPVKLDIKKHEPPPRVDRDYYWCGATEDCPASLTLGGFSFPKSIGKISDGADGSQMLQENAYRGEIHLMTKENVALVLQHAANKVVRSHRQEVTESHDGKRYVRWLGKIVSKSGSRVAPYVVHGTDRALGEFAYMVKVRHGSDRPMSDPPPMVQRAE